MKSTRATAKPLRDARLTAINFVADAVNRALDLKEIADNALHAVLAVMKLDAGAVYVWQDAEQGLRLFAWRGFPEAFARQAVQIRKGDDATIDRVLDGATAVIEDFKLQQHIFRFDAVRAGFEAAVLAPIRAQGFVVGLLALGNYRARPFARDDIDLIEAITNQIGNAMVHAQLQADLRASEEQYRSLVENSEDAIYIADPAGRPRFANTAFRRMFGFSPEELAQGDPLERVHPEDRETVRQALARLGAGEVAPNLEYRFQRQDGQWIDLQGNGSVFARDGRAVKELQFVVREVTEAKRRQQQLVRRNRQLAALTMLAGVANSSLNIEEIARNTLEVALQTTGLDGGAVHLADASQTRLDLYVQIGLPPEVVAHLRRLRWGEPVSGEVAATGEPRIYRDLREEAPVGFPAAAREFQALIVVPVKTKGEVLGTLELASRQPVSFSREVTEMVMAMGNQLGIALANARLYGDLRDKNNLLELLIEEAHHRIKNNLQMVSGLLQLQADAAVNRETAAHLRSANARIHAIARVHNLLSEEMPEQVDAQALITAVLNPLVANDLVTGPAPVVELAVDHLWLSSEQAVALALIINELVSNSLLHGRPAAGQPLHLSVACHREGAAACVEVRDNGGGFGPGQDWRRGQGQGMSIVAQLAQVNLRGQLEISNRAGGVAARLQFGISSPDSGGSPAAVARTPSPASADRPTPTERTPGACPESHEGTASLPKTGSDTVGPGVG